MRSPAASRASWIGSSRGAPYPATGASSGRANAARIGSLTCTSRIRRSLHGRMVSADPHLEEVTPYTAIGRRAAVAQVMVAVGGFVAAVALVPDRLPIIAFYVGLSFVGGLFMALLTWRRLRRLLTAASPVPRAAVEVERHGSRIRLVRVGRWERRNGRI